MTRVDPAVLAATAAHTADFPWLRRYPSNVNWHQNFTGVPLHHLLIDAAERFGDRPAANFFGRITTYRELHAQAEVVAAGLQRLGVTQGTKVGLLLPNTPTFVIYYYAVLMAGGTVVNYNPLYTIEELSFQVKDSETELMITLDLKVLFDKVEKLLSTGTLARAVVASFPDLLPRAKSILYRLLKRSDLAHPKSSSVASKLIFDDAVRSGGSEVRRTTIDPRDELAVLQYTGGTTGTPKGAMLTHANLSINVHQSMAWVPDLEPGNERILAALPFFHVFAMTSIMNFAIASGAEIVMMPRFVLADALKLIAKTRPTIMPAVPTMLIAMLNHPKISSFDLSSLKFCLSGGAPLLLETKQRFEALTGCSVVEGYGLSETSPAVTANPLAGPVKELSIGQPLPATRVSLRDPADPARQVPQGEKGEICISGPQVMKGYWKKPADTRDVLTPDGFLRTGDIATMDDDGFIYIVDRIKDLIICSGYNVYPRTLEEAISKHPAVEEVTVIGIKDAYRGEAPKAFIKLRAGQTATSDDILRHLEPLLSKIELPTAIEFRATLPKTLIGKLSKKELKAEEAQRLKAK